MKGEFCWLFFNVLYMTRNMVSVSFESVPVDQMQISISGC